jgi:hypothetical protein
VLTFWRDSQIRRVPEIDELRQDTVMLDDATLDGAIRARSASAQIDHRYPARTMHFVDPSQWPPRWQRSTGVDPADRLPRGRTLTIAEVLASAPGTRVDGSIVGRVVGLSGNSDGRLAAVNDGTGSIDVWCPATTCIWGPIMSRSFEFDIVADGGAAPSRPRVQLHRDVTSAALAGDLTTAQRGAAELARGVGAHATTTVATAVRPAD